MNTASPPLCNESTNNTDCGRQRMSSEAKQIFVQGTLGPQTVSTRISSQQDSAQLFRQRREEGTPAVVVERFFADGSVCPTNLVEYLGVTKINSS
jgi:hypothetical protein